jgi:transmembrane sensor
VGEQKTITLDDGSRLVLNTATAVALKFTATERRLHLIEGEILVATAKDDASHPFASRPLASRPVASRPFIVSTAEGELWPAGTRFSVRQMQDDTRLAVFEGAVHIHTEGGRQGLCEAGMETRFNATTIHASVPVHELAAMWEHGMLAARDMPLAELVEELGRYRPGILRCHPDVAQLRVSGAFPLTDTDASLALLVKTRPLTLRRLTRYWVSVEPAPSTATG